MNKFLLIAVVCVGFFSCAKEEDYEKKEVIREYLQNTLHDPESLEEIQWTIMPDWELKRVDSLDSNSPFEIDYYATHKKPDSLNFSFIRLEFRAKNGYGAMRKSEVYAFYSEIGGPHIQFDNALYSYNTESFISDESIGLMDPKRLFLRNYYFYQNSGKGTVEGYWEKYPEYR